MNRILFKRVMATIIDYFLMGIFLFVYPILFGESNDGVVYKMEGVVIYIPFAIGFFYLVFMEYLFGATIGYRIFSLRVKTIDTLKITFTQAFKRRFADIIDIQFSIGLVALFFLLNTTRQQRLGDLWAKTIVVDKSNDEYSDFLKTELTLTE